MKLSVAIFDSSYTPPLCFSSPTHSTPSIISLTGSANSLLVTSFPTPIPIPQVVQVYLQCTCCSAKNGQDNIETPPQIPSTVASEMPRLTDAPTPHSVDTSSQSNPLFSISLTNSSGNLDACPITTSRRSTHRKERVSGIRESPCKFCEVLLRHHRNTTVIDINNGLGSLFVYPSEAVCCVLLPQAGMDRVVWDLGRVLQSVESGPT
ncbi:hypothetical protein SLE2022_202210 [Rubroshorea leprosula]